MQEASKLVLLNFMALQGPGKNDLSQYNELYVLCVYNLLQSHKRFTILNKWKHAVYVTIP